MAKTLLSILLYTSLVAQGMGPRATHSAETSSSPAVAQEDTSRLFAPDTEWRGDWPWVRRDPRVLWDAHWSSARGTGTRRAAARSVGAMTTGNPVADPTLWGANEKVLDMVRSGNTLYIAGTFRSVGENSGGLVPFDARTGEQVRPFPKVAGFVAVIVPDGSGGWYIGGEFTAVAGKPRSCLAQIRADGSVSDWNPSVTGSPGYIDPPAVVAIAVRGDRVYMGGGFREIGGVLRMNLGCVDVRTGAVLDWNPGTHVDGFVSVLAIHDSTVYVGGWFSSIGGQSRTNLAAVNAATGTVRSWQADATGSVSALLFRGDTLFVAGEFGWIAGGWRRFLAAIDVRTAQLLPFDAHAQGIYRDYLPNPRVSSMVLVGDTLYTAGLYTQIGGQIRGSIAAGLSQEVCKRPQAAAL